MEEHNIFENVTKKERKLKREKNSRVERDRKK